MYRTVYLCTVYLCTVTYVLYTYVLYIYVLYTYVLYTYVLYTYVHCTVYRTVYIFVPYIQYNTQRHTKMPQTTEQSPFSQSSETWIFYKHLCLGQHLGSNSFFVSAKHVCFCIPSQFQRTENMGSVIYIQDLIQVHGTKGVLIEKRIYTEDKTKVVAAVWGTELIPFLAPGLYDEKVELHQDDMKKRMNCTRIR